MPKGYDFCGWATKNDLKCADNRIIRHGAFKENDGKRVPLVWNHQHNSPEDTLGHAILENRDEGIYAYCYFNNNPSSQAAKENVKHGDVESLSIWANNLYQVGNEVLHGVIREVSLVLAGANPGAFIESVLAHGESISDDEDEGIFFTGESISFEHSDISDEKEKPKEKPKDDKKDDDSNGNETIQDTYNSFTDKQKQAVAIIVGQAIEDSKNEDKKEDKEMKHNAFDDANDKENKKILTHSMMNEVVGLAFKNKSNSLRDTFRQYLNDNDIDLEHSINTTGMETSSGKQTYGFNDPSMLFPDYKSLNNPPEWISRNMDWVQKVMGTVHHTPFSRIKSVYANITEEEARARGYIKGKQKKEEVFPLLRRTTDPQTVYKLQKLDRDDILDITDYDIVMWLRAEMRVMLNEEIARAILIGDGRSAVDESKISEEHIRPVVNDVPLFNTKVLVNVDNGSDANKKAKETINAVIKARKNYKGSGNPTFYTTEDVVTDMLLLEDTIGHKLYKSEAELAVALRVKEIVTVEPMEGMEVDNGLDGGQKKDLPLVGVIVNLADYNVGADKGGEITNFDDFDIDYNQYKYLIETRISGALVKPFAALTILMNEAAAG